MSYKQLGSEVIPRGTCHEVWAARRKASSEAAKARRGAEHKKRVGRPVRPGAALAAAGRGVSPWTLAALLRLVGEDRGGPTTLLPKLQRLPASAVEPDLAEWEPVWIEWPAQWTMLPREELTVNAEAQEGGSGDVVPVDEERPWA